MPRLAVDWDGTCVTDSWPAMGTWLPGAIEALRKLSAISTVVIHTSRIAPMELHDETISRPAHLVAMELNGIRAMLDAEGLHDIEVWQKPWKPGAVAYIDNKAVKYNGRPGAWPAITARIEALLQEDSA